MAAPRGHDRSRPQTNNDEVEDPLEKMLDKTGCKELHYLVQVSGVKNHVLFCEVGYFLNFDISKLRFSFCGINQNRDCLFRDCAIFIRTMTGTGVQHLK